MQGRTLNMKMYAKIDRSTGGIVKRKEFDNPKRALNKPFVWLPEEQNDKPVFNKETHKLVQTIAQSDLSDLAIDVSPDVKRVFGWDVVALNSEEKEKKKLSKIAESDVDLVRFTEVILVAIAQGDTLEKDSFPDEVWNKVNARRTLRGESEI
tara:strand:- start:450 stop:905 length:456 start_codon:yes stop_codon:yes gene_type:complete